MPTQTLTRPQNVPVIPADIEEADYPPEVIEEWDRDFELAKLKIATGELRPMTNAEIAAAVGFKI